MSGISDVPIEDGLVSRTGAQKSGVPAEGSDSVGVADERPNFFHPFDVPDLDLTSLATDGDIRVFLRPSDSSDEGISHVA